MQYKREECGLSILSNLQGNCENFIDFYWIALCLVGTFLAGGFRNKMMQLFLVILSLSTILSLNFVKVYQIGKLESYVGVPICLLLEMLILFSYYLLEQESAKSKGISEKICFLITCGVIAYEYLVPSLKNIEKLTNATEKYVAAPYIIMQMSLAILAVIAFIAFGKRTETNKQDKKPLFPVPNGCKKVLDK